MKITRENTMHDLTTLDAMVEFILIETGMDISTKSRKRDYCIARSVYCAVARKFFDKKVPYEVIGIPINRDHATVIHNSNNIYPSYERHPLRNQLAEKLIRAMSVLNSNSMPSVRTITKDITKDLQVEMLQDELLTDNEKVYRTLPMELRAKYNERVEPILKMLKMDAERMADTGRY
jgi:hypothetical protein